MTAPTITHDRDLIVDDDTGGVDQDYRFLDYDFAPMGVAAWGRMYLDQSASFSFRTVGIRWLDQPKAVRDYLMHRFDRVNVLGPAGYATIWQRQE